MKINIFSTIYKAIRCVVLPIFLFGSFKAMAQPVNNLVKDVVMPAPNAAALGKYGDYTIGNFTGVPDISIPIHTVQEGSLSLPISLNYHASGIKVAEMASWVGAGWSLNAGGIISRTVQGLPDDKPFTGYYATGANLETQYNQAVAGNTTILFGKEIADGQKDGEPDFFSFNVMGYTGKFYIDAAHKIQIIPKQDIKIDIDYIPNSDMDFQGFTITPPDGTRYIFGKNPSTGVTAQERSLMQGSSTSESNYISSWYLVKIESYDKKYNITLNYETDKYSYLSNASGKITQTFGTPVQPYNSYPNCSINLEYYATSSNGIDGYHKTNTINVDGKKLSQILTSTQTINFIADSDRMDLGMHNNYSIKSKALNAIEIKSGILNTPSYSCKKFQFQYDYFIDNSYVPIVGFEYLGKKLRLLNLTEQSCDGSISNPPYTFTYEGNFLPFLLSKATDHWGFYNGATGNETKLINIPPTSLSNPLGGSPFTKGTSDRESNETHMKKGVLKEVQFPTGGKTTFTYEANTVLDFLIAPPQTVVELRNCGIMPSSACCGAQSSQPAYYTITADDITTGEFTLKLENPNLMNLPEPTNCSNNNGISAKIDVYKASNDSLVGSLILPLNSTQLSATIVKQLTYLGTFVPGTNYKFVLTGISSYAYFKLTKQSLVSQQANKQVGGLRVKEIKSHDGVSTANDIIKTYNYNEIDANGNSGTVSSAVLLRKPKYALTVNDIDFVSQDALVHLSLGHTLIYNDEPVVPLYTFEGNHIGYRYVKESTTNNGYKLYKYRVEFPNYYQYANSYPIPPTPPVVSNGTLNSEKTVSQNNLTLQQTLNEKNTETETPNSGKIFKAQSMYFPCLQDDSGVNSVYAYFMSNYQIKTKPFRLLYTIQAIDGVETLTNYTYSTDPTQPLFPITTSMKNSDGTTETVTTNKYITHPDYINSTSPATSQLAKRMKNLNIIASPMETTVTVGGVQSNGSRTIFSCFNSAGLPTSDTINNYPYPYQFLKYKMTLDGSNQPQVFPTNGGWDLEGTINEYDIARGKPKKFTMANWADPELYTWDTNGMIKTRKFKDFTWTYDYFPNTRLVQKITNIDGQYSLFEYDNFQRVTKATARGGAVVTDYTYKYQDATQSNKNWIETKTTFTSPIGGLLFSNTTFKTARQYLDGLGRPIQSVAVANSPTGKDVISAVAYDNQGREWKKYEPYESTFSTGNFVAPTTQLFTEMKYEESPLSRLWKSILPNGWQSSTTVYSSNTGSDAYNLGTWSSFPVNSVNKTTTTDPDGRISIIYTDKKGRKIQTEQTKAGSPLNTLFYSYDLKDRLMRVWTVRNQYEEWATANDIDFLYNYDYNDNVTAKYIPGAAYQGFVYNERNQLVMSHDGNQRGNQQWLATTYDEYGRPTASGLTTNLTNSSVITGNPTITTLLSSTEYSATTGIELGKVKRTKSFYNSGANNIETVFDYDSYGRAAFAYSNNHLYNPSGVISATNFSEKIATTYDLADNVLVKTRTHKPNATTTRTINETTDYDNGLRLKQVKHQLDAMPEQIVSLMDYTLKNQVQTKQMGKVGGLPFLQKVDYAYNVLGFLTGINNLTDLSGTTIQGITCEYPQSNTNSTTNADVNDLFMLDLRYDNPNTAYAPAGTTATPQYNGNISQAIWRVRGRERQSYTFQYDFLNRMTEANYAEINNLGAKTNDQNKYMEKLTYDMRGNIKTLKRNGLNTTSCTVGLIDNLTYYYADDTNISYSPGNRLKKVFDIADKTRGFKTQPNNNTLTDAAYLYTYDANGNLKTDPNKKITNIQYNQLNLPTQVTFSNGNAISFLYDGSGTKLRKTVSGTENYVQDYVGGIEYRSDANTGNIPTLEAIYHSEGRITTVNGSLKYEYALRDHLGNTRVMFCDKNNDGYITPTYYQGDNEVTQENSYYPYGLAMEGYWMNNPLVTDNKYGYNGKELNSDFGLELNDYGARFYDSAVDRWWNIDPESESGEQKSWNPYHYVFDNPIKNTDPNGKQPCPPGEDCDGGNDNYKNEAAQSFIDGMYSLSKTFIASAEAEAKIGASSEFTVMRTGLKAEANLVKLSAGVDTEVQGIKSEVKILHLEIAGKHNNQKYGVDGAAVNIKTTIGSEGASTKVKLGEAKIGNLSGDVKGAIKNDAKVELGLGVGPVKLKAGINLTEGKKAFTKIAESAKTYIKGKIDEITKWIPKF